MKNRLKKVVLATLLAGSTLMAGSTEYQFNTESLVGIEGGYSSFDTESVTGGITTRTTYDFGHAGFKIGAQSQNYRVFVSVRVYDIGDFDYARTYGAELQYKFNFIEQADFFIGANAGIADMRFVDSVSDETINIYDPYYGVDAGFNVHINDMFDVELGARMITLNANEENSAGTTAYKFDYMVAGYASLIIKFDLD